MCVKKGKPINNRTLTIPDIRRSKIISLAFFDFDVYKPTKEISELVKETFDVIYRKKIIKYQCFRLKIPKDDLLSNKPAIFDPESFGTLNWR